MATNGGKIMSAVGICGGLLMFGAGLLHSFAGWPALGRTLAATNVPANVVLGLAVPWHFAGMSMMAFGLLAAWNVWKQSGSGRRGTVLAVGTLYVLFTIWAAVAVEANPFLLIFLVPGLMVLGAGLAGRS